MDDIIKVYGASWCPDCRRAKRFLGDQRVSFEWHDIEVDPDGVRAVQERNNGNNIIPTIIFPDGSHLAEPSNEEQAEKYGVEMLQAVSVNAITTDGEGCDVETATGDHYHARAVLIATGSTYRRTGADGEEDLIGAGIHFCATCDGPFYKGAKELVVLGGGNSALEEGLFLTQFVDKVTIVQRGDRLTANKLLVDKVLMTPKMEVLYNRTVTGFRAKDDGSGKLGAITIQNTETGETEELHPAGCFVFIGLDPNTEFIKGQVDLDDRGLILTDMGLQTSMPGVFAAGDVRSGPTKQLASGGGEGAAAAIGIRMSLESLDSKPVHMM